MYRPRQSTVQHNDKTGAERWLISYADYMTLLFALFVVLFSLSSMKKEQFDAISQTIAGLFAAQQQASARPLGDQLLPAESETTVMELESTGVEAQAKGPTLLTEHTELVPFDESKLGSPLAELDAEFRQSLTDLTEKGLAKIQRDDEWLTIELSSSMLFSSGSATPNNSAKAVMQALTELLQRHQNYLRVRGYTDSEPIHNELFPSNWELSVARATAILRLLQDFGITPGRLAAEGYGQYSPFAENSSEAGRAENRKVVIAVSRFAYQAPAPVAAAAENTLTVPDAGAVTQQSDEVRIRVIRLPHGGIRISTRPPAPGEAEVSPTQQEQ
ncbi:OmpA family protein [Rheinheimera sp.]|uniref:flagellar motor protein MotB n=1 Tax=Rheinheimera sp. TaxID=1869214 RepID=UPI00307E84A4